MSVFEGSPFYHQVQYACIILVALFHSFQIKAANDGRSTHSKTCEYSFSFDSISANQALS